MIDPGYQSIRLGVTVLQRLSEPDGPPVNIWERTTVQITTYKSHLKRELRTAQLGRCCFCRRRLGDIRDTHLEHYLEKSAYPNLTFKTQNLALSCSTCNGHKNVAFIKLSTAISKRRRRLGPIKVVHQCPGLLGSWSDTDGLQHQAYRWIHPHFDHYGTHLSIEKGWIFVPVTDKGRRCIKYLKLNQLGEIERRARQERLAERDSALGLFFAGIAEANRGKIRDIVDDILEVMRQAKARRPA